MARTKVKTPAGQEVMVVTQEGYDQMVAEHELRKTETRDAIAADIRAAKELGDLSENAAYSDAMERKEMNEARISELEYLISIAQVTTTSVNDKVIGIGHTVEVQKLGSSEVRALTLVGKAQSQQANPEEGKISVDSPIGKALHMAEVGQTVVVQLPAADVKYKVLRIVA